MHTGTTSLSEVDQECGVAPSARFLRRAARRLARLRSPEIRIRLLTVTIDGLVGAAGFRAHSHTQLQFVR